MRESGISLPTRRTLNDYTHWIAAKPGFSCEVDEYLLTEAKINDLDNWQRFVHTLVKVMLYHRYVVLIIDGMKVRRYLVYEKNGRNTTMRFCEPGWCYITTNCEN